MLQIAENLMNLKIESPDDDNYSDDELTFLPYLTFAYALKHLPGSSFLQQMLASLERTWAFVRPHRSAAWNSIYVAAGGSNASQADIDTIAW